MKALALSFVLSATSMNAYAQKFHQGDSHPTHSHPDSTVLFIPEYYPEFYDMVHEVAAEAGIKNLKIQVMRDRSKINNLHGGYIPDFDKGYLWVSNADFKNFSLPALKGVVGHEVGHMVLRMKKIPWSDNEEWRADSLAVEQGLGKHFTLWLQEYDNLNKDKITAFDTKAKTRWLPMTDLSADEDTIFIDTREIDFTDPKALDRLRMKHHHVQDVVRYIDAIEALYQKHGEKIPTSELVDMMHVEFNKDLDKLSIHKSPPKRIAEVKKLTSKIADRPEPLKRSNPISPSEILRKTGALNHRKR